MSSTLSPIKVLVVDDHDLTRYSLKLLLQNEANFDLIGLASNGLEAIQLLKENPCDIVILDLQMPVMDGLTAAVHLKTIDPNVKIIGYSSVEDPQIEVMAQTAPIDVFCPKEIEGKRLIAVIQELFSDHA